jgi:hypothetical protein
VHKLSKKSAYCTFIIQLLKPLVLNLLSDGYQGAPSPGVKQLGCEADHSPPSTAEIVWSYTSTPCLRCVDTSFMMWYFIKHRGNFTFTYRNVRLIPFKPVSFNTGTPVRQFLPMLEVPLGENSILGNANRQFIALNCFHIINSSAFPGFLKFGEH